MSKRDFPHRDRIPHTDEEIRAYTVGEIEPLSNGVLIANYNPRWTEVFAHEADKIQTALGSPAVCVEHVGSTSVPGLAAKPVIDILLLVLNSADEKEYVPVLERNGYVLRVREPNWYEHRMLKGLEKEINLHVFSVGCPEVDRILLFRDWLRRNDTDRDLYASTKMALAKKQWKHIQTYADAKTGIIEEIIDRALASGSSNESI